MAFITFFQAISFVFDIIGFMKPDYLAFVITEKVLGEISAAFLWTVPTSLAQTWFPESQIARLAIGIALINLPLGRSYELVFAIQTTLNSSLNLSKKQKLHYHTLVST